MNSNQFDECGNPEQQFLEAFTELLDIQNQRMQNGNDLMNQQSPQFLYPIIIPTQIPNTFIVNMGPYYPHIQQPELNTQIYQQQRIQQQQTQQNLFKNHQTIKEEEQDENKQFQNNWLQQKKQ